MNAIIVENIVSWFLFALASTCTLSFASRAYDNFVSRKRRERDKKPGARILPRSDSKPSPLLMEKPVTRGYDSPELFREDLWIRRIEHSRMEHALLAASIPPVKANFGAPEDYSRRLCEMLAHHARTRPR
jgi:hypothetical protein